MLPYTFFAFSAGFSQGPSVYELHISRSLVSLRPHAPVLIGLGILFGGLFIVGFMALRHHPEAAKLLILWLVVPVLGVLGISAVTDFAYNVRYVTMALPAYMLILASGITYFRRPVVQVSLLAVVLLSNGVSLANYYHNPRYAREDARSAVKYLTAAVQPGDLVLVVGPAWILRYYAQENLKLLSLSALPKSGQPIIERVQALQKAPNRLWLVEIRPWETDPTGKVKAALAKAYNLIEHKQLPGVDIYAYAYHHNKDP